MMKVSYYRSEDPVLKALTSGRDTIFDRPYAGYFLFLFGQADEAAATWFAKNLVALDSLTGSSLAGLVFAERVKASVQRVTTEQETRHRYVRPLHGGESLAIGEISLGAERKPRNVSDQHDDGSQNVHATFRLERLVNRQLGVVYDPEVEISAVTYGSDQIARDLKVQDQLPCIVLMNALPTGAIEVISLRDQNPDEVLRVLRQVVAHFTQQKRYEQYFRLMEKMYALIPSLADHRTSREKLQNSLREEHNQSLEDQLWTVRLRQAFVKGRHKQYSSILRKNALDKDDETRLRAFLGLHRSRLFQLLESRASDAGQAVSELEHELERILPPRELLIAQLESKRGQRIGLLQEQIAQLDQLILGTEERLQQFMSEIAGCDIPNLEQTFRNLSRSTTVKSASQHASSEVWGILKGWLKPETLMKIAEHFHKF